MSSIAQIDTTQHTNGVSLKEDSQVTQSSDSITKIKQNLTNSTKDQLQSIFKNTAIDMSQP